MNPAEFWKNFGLGEEVSISGAFIYNGLRRFHELRKLDYADEIFEVFYYLSVGLERLLKIAVVLLEHKDDGDQEALEVQRGEKFPQPQRHRPLPGSRWRALLRHRV